MAKRLVRTATEVERAAKQPGPRVFFLPKDLGERDVDLRKVQFNSAMPSEIDIHVVANLAALESLNEVTGLFDSDNYSVPCFVVRKGTFANCKKYHVVSGSSLSNMMDTLRAWAAEWNRSARF